MNLYPVLYSSVKIRGSGVARQGTDTCPAYTFRGRERVGQGANCAESKRPLPCPRPTSVGLVESKATRRRRSDGDGNGEY